MGLPATATVGDDVPKLLSKILSGALLNDQVLVAAAPDSQGESGEVVTSDSIIAAVASLVWIPHPGAVANVLRHFAEAHESEDKRCVDAELQRREALGADAREPPRFAERPGATEAQKTKLSDTYTSHVNNEVQEVRALAPRRTAAFVLAALVGFVCTDLAHRAFAYNPASRVETSDMSSDMLKALDSFSCWCPKDVVAAAAAAKREARPDLPSSPLYPLPTGIDPRCP